METNRIDLRGGGGGGIWDSTEAKFTSCLFLSLQAFSFFTMLLSIGMIFYFIVARYVFKWSTHGEQAPKGQASSAGGNYTIDDQ